ncbi:MAG: GNAT family N-acetyltransferase [Acidobacteriota bacterium]
MTAVVPVEPALLERVLDHTHPLSPDGLDRLGHGKLSSAQSKTAWGRRSQHRFALVDGVDLLAGAEQYDLDGMADGRPIRICGIGSLFTHPAHRGQGHAPALLETLLERARRAGAELALLFAPPGLEGDVRAGFAALPLTEATLDVGESPRHGAPMTMVRGGEERDLPAIVAMGRVRAERFRFHLDRDVDLVQYAITRKRLLAGLSPPARRQLHFFIAEEGTTAAAYVVVTIAGDTWTLEECGDRDPSGARVGALLQALIAREPGERRPTIRSWLPPGFLPPQITLASAVPAAEAVMVRSLNAPAPQWSAEDVLYWRNDVF